MDFGDACNDVGRYSVTISRVLSVSHIPPHHLPCLCRQVPQSIVGCSSHFLLKSSSTVFGRPSLSLRTKFQEKIEITSNNIALTNQMSQNSR